ncbi:hypothetical protein [Bacillus cereus group sp. MYBK81-2]|uniref:hypothetical protein n=1 Tax=Bacillus cereus group sp. MYBK81-2 TaxID=3450604 RepID=UPI003F79B3B8
MKNGKQKDLPVMHQAVLDVLPKGRFNAMTTVEIMARAGIEDERAVSEIIRELVVKYKRPVATSSRMAFKGVFIVQDIIDYQLGRETLTKRKNSILDREEAYTEACLEIFKGTVTLDESKNKVEGSIRTCKQSTSSSM